VYGTPDTSTFRYRVFNVIEAVRAMPDSRIRAGWFAASEIASVRQILPRLTTLVLARVQISRAMSDLITAARLHGVRILLDCDDLVFDVRFAQLVSVNNDQDFDSEAHLFGWYGYVGRLQAVAQQCDGGITTNAFLAEKLAAVCQAPVSIIPNFLNKRQQELSARLLAAKAERGFDPGKRVMIGYFSGSPTHNRDFQAALDALIQLMDEDDSVGARIVGYMSGHERLARFGDRVERIDLQDWLNLQVKIAEVDINIAPLQLNDFTNCKSELKFFEAAIVGSYTIASRSYAFQRAIDAPEQGMVIDNGDWYPALKAAVARVRNVDAYAQTAMHTAEAVISRYGWDRNTERIVATLEAPLSYGASRKGPARDGAP
jgi:glycosyltransferase involved in cell wall biosynthesis